MLGEVEVLGGFCSIPPGTRPGWIVKATGLHKTEFLVAVIPDDIDHIYGVKVIDSVPWDLWMGNLLDHSWAFMNGDHPVQYTRNRTDATTIQSSL
jgi:hypothetical protein